MISLSRWLLSILCVLVLRADSSAAEPPRPLIVAHRGLLNHAPENTLANFRACLELRIGFEFDVQQTADGELVCIHDSTVDRTTDGTGAVSEMTLEQIRQLDAGRWFDPGFAGETVPTVDEVLELIAEFRDFDILVAVDIKAANVEQDVVRLAAEHAVLEQLIFIGRTISEPRVRDQIQSASMQAHAAAVANDTDEFPAALAAASADWVYVRYLPSREQIEEVHRAGKRAFIAGATVSGEMPEHWRQAIDVEIDAILTDYPLELQTVCRQDAAGD